MDACTTLLEEAYIALVHGETTEAKKIFPAVQTHCEGSSYAKIKEAMQRVQEKDSLNNWVELDKRFVETIPLRKRYLYNRNASMHGFTTVFAFTSFGRVGPYAWYTLNKGAK